MVTSAQFQVLNDGPRNIVINAESHYLHNNLATPLNVAAGLPAPDPPAEIQADDSPNQSWIDLQWSNNRLGVNLGRINYTTGVAVKSSSGGQSEVVCAPTDPGNANGWDFFFWILASQTNLRNIVNSVLDANRGALKHFINAQDFTLDLAGIKLKVLDIDITKLECTYAAVSKQGKRTPWMANIVLKYSGQVKGSFKLPFDVGFDDLQVMLSVSLDTRDSKEKLKIEVTRLQCAANNISNFPLAGPMSYYVPGVVNTNMNADILNALNDKIKIFIPTAMDLGVLEKYNLEDYVKPATSTADHRSWMSNALMQAKTLSQLKIPGTHDSAAYGLELVLSTVMYDFAFLKDVYPDSAPTDHDFKSKKYYIGQTAYTWLMEQISYIGQSHDSSKTIQKQLEDGVRFFDLRIYYDERVGDYYFHHGLRCPSLSAILDQIKGFLSADSKATEFAIFQISHNSGSFDKPDKATHAAKVAQMVKEKLGQWLWMPEGAAPDQPFDFQKLGSLTLSAITAGSSKVLWIDPDDCKYPHSILNVKGDAVYPSKESVAPGSGLYGRWLTMTPAINECAGCILMNCYNANDKRHVKILQRASRKLNSTARKVLQEQPHLNMIAMDWYTEADGELPIDVIIAANQ
jgi:hypothetical protein